MRTKLCCVLMMIGAAAMMGAPSVSAQVSTVDLLEQVRADTEADRQALVALNLELTDAQGQAFWPVYRAYRADMSKIGDRMQKLILDYSEVWTSATEEQARDMVKEMLAIQRDEVKVRKSHLGKFRKVLPEVKVARFLQIENKIDAVVKIGLADSIPLVIAAD